MDYMLIIYFVLMMIVVLISMAFLTLLERKVLGYIQIRKGPNKVGYVGILQPFSDAMKLFLKEQTYPYLCNYLIYWFCPIVGLVLSLIIWLIFPFFTYYISFEFGLLFFLCCLSMGVYSVMLAGWSSNSSYSLLGSLRAVAQTISYEVSLSLILLSFIYMVEGFKLINFYYYQEFIWFIIFNLPLSLIWFSSMLAETNRTPFDFAEGESELVSGFNVEYSSGSFALIFMAEYVSILFMSMMIVILSLGCDVKSILFFIKILLISFLFIWVRGTLPRFRYDKLMYMSWSIYLPLSLNYLMFFVGMKVLFLSIMC
uniref:NADH-ubiquinone oxidoreductase chain 1 n=1 Tax=Ornebius bimaculatus TaxID=2153490 RepID=A0A385I200_9ORTH|nr:NADH dehydrogenase subunit 1 [Ornebius bimaculatus]AXY63936.1 NADH dehydrogenase subunit 1 [Ornebius bimaculatus]